MKEKFRRFMEGRYGTDKLNMAILVLGLAFSLLGLFIRVPIVYILLQLAAYVMMGIAIFRCLRRGMYRRSKITAIHDLRASLPVRGRILHGLANLGGGSAT